MSKCILFCLVFALGAKFINCNCYIHINNIFPIFEKDFGSKKIIFKPTSDNIELEKNDYIRVFCASKLLANNIEDSSSNAIIGCTNTITYKGSSDASFRSTYDSRIVLECTSDSLSLYESNRTLPNCDKFLNYAIGLRMPGTEDDIAAAICYDLERSTLKFAKYIAQDCNDGFKLSKQCSSAELKIDLSDKLDDLHKYRNYINHEQFLWRLEELRSQNMFMTLYDFDFEILLSYVPLSNKLNNFSHLFNTIWWRNLRNGNWFQFFNALQQRTANRKYIVYMGTYANITIPTSHCNQTETFTVESEDSTVVAPAYIWAYLKSLETDSEPEEFVIIAHNSPFAQNPDSKAFCKQDICDDIPWLRASKFGGLRKIPTLGYTFCCRPEDVAKVIDYFPWQQQESLLQKETTTSKLYFDETTTYSINEIN